MKPTRSLFASLVLGTSLGAAFAACTPEYTPPCETCDRDGDGVRSPDDCNDSNPDVHPGNEEIAGNNIDDDCEGGDAVLEVCGNGVDDDEDEATDCHDEECSAELQFCTGCMGAVPITTGWSGTTVGANDIVDGCGAGPEHVFSYLPAIATTPALLGFVSISVVGATPHVASIRTACGDADTELDCVEYTDIVELVVADDDALTIIVEPVDVPGPYQLILEYEPLVCGDDREVGPEECDDGNNESGDGCDAECRLEA